MNILCDLCTLNRKSLTCFATRDKGQRTKPRARGSIVSTKPMTLQRWLCTRKACAGFSMYRISNVYFPPYKCLHYWISQKVKTALGPRMGNFLCGGSQIWEEFPTSSLDGKCQNLSICRYSTSIQHFFSKSVPLLWMDFPFTVTVAH